MSRPITHALAFTLLIVITAASCKQPGSEQASVSDVTMEQQKQPAPPASTPPADQEADWKVRTYANTDGNAGFGFDVLNGEKIYVHQPTMPAVQGIQGFRTEAEARACGELMLYKIRNGILPPSVSVAELDSIGVSH